MCEPQPVINRCRRCLRSFRSLLLNCWYRLCRGRSAGDRHREEGREPLGNEIRVGLWSCSRLMLLRRSLVLLRTRMVLALSLVRMTLELRVGATLLVLLPQICLLAILRVVVRSVRLVQGRLL